ncbi:MAG: LysM peptidoglycan-binding domain-containing protein, partial [Deltaproteobacteria bacterium]|nr:LysM peptidoglycan-binding domain-containing protein [Deltaproteobacteria bacterium]
FDSTRKAAMKKLLATTAVALALAGPVRSASAGTPAGVQTKPPGPSKVEPRELEMDDSRRRAVRGCPVGYDCHERLSAEMRRFELRQFRRKGSPWIESDSPGAKPKRRFRRKVDPVKLRPDLPWLGKLQMPDIPVVWDERVIAYLEFYKNDPRGRRIMAAWLKAQGRYKKMIARELRRARLPRDLLYVAMIESSYDPTEYSRSGASGLWQFMPGGGRIYGLQINRWVDERNDILLSTRAALGYLSDLHDRFGNWHLALAAYNAGYGAVLRGMAKYNTNDFWRLLDYENALPWESSIYVPKAIATAIVGNNRAIFGFDNLKDDPEVQWDHVDVPKSVRLSVIARAAGVKTKDIKALNPQLRRGRTPPGVKRYVVRVPRGTKRRFATRFPQMRGDWDDVDAYVVRHGERFEDIATRFGISRSKLRQLNGVKTEAEIRGGSVLVVPKVDKSRARSNQKKANDDLYASGYPRGTPGDDLLVAVPQKNFKVPGSKRVFYRVVSGDSLFSIARAFGIDRHALARWNGLDPETHLQARMVLQVFASRRFNARAAGIKLLDSRRILLVQSGSREHLERAEEMLGRKRVVFRAKKRISFEDIGKRYGLGRYDLARINRMSPSTVLDPGQEIFVYEVSDPKASDRAKEQARKARKSRKHKRKAKPKRRRPKKKSAAPSKSKRALAKAETKKVETKKPETKKPEPKKPEPKKAAAPPPDGPKAEGS